MANGQIASLTNPPTKLSCIMVVVADEKNLDNILTGLTARTFWWSWENFADLMNLSSLS